MIEIDNKLKSVFGLAVFVFSITLFAITFTEVQFLNATYHIGNTTVSFQGFPWDTKQLAGFCLIRTAADGQYGPDCAFPNYKYLVEGSFVLAFIGYVVWRYYRPIVETRLITREEQFQKHDKDKKGD